MANSITPFKKVCLKPILIYPIVLQQLILLIQAASKLEALKMDGSPMKNISLDHVGKENIPHALALSNEDFDGKIHFDEVPKKEQIQAPTVSNGIKPEDSDEPLLQDNPNRFVLFPIKYHEVCIQALQVK